MASTYLSPGVYVEEVDRGTKPIEAAGTNTLAFLGECSVGPVNEPILVTNWSQFTKNFGDFQNSEYLAHAVYGFFNNGGGRAYIVKDPSDPARIPTKYQRGSGWREDCQQGGALHG